MTILGTSIVGIWGHDAQTTRMASLTLSEATGGRFVLGLGVSHPHLASVTRPSKDLMLGDLHPRLDPPSHRTTKDST